MGYSLNDTIIVYDRIRENMSVHTKHDLVDGAEPQRERDAVAHAADLAHDASSRDVRCCCSWAAR